MKCVIYCRVSSKDQIEGTSLESQEASCRDHAIRHGMSISRVFIEQGESAKFADRTALLELLSYCQNRQNGVGILLVWKIDRFARNVEDHYALKAALRKAGVQIASVTEPIQEDPNGKLLETILAGFAQFDNDIRAMRTIQGMQQRLREGIFPWKPPLGYLPPRLLKKTEPDKPDPTRFEPIRKALELFATGAYTKGAILRRLRDWGVSGFRGGALAPQRLDELLTNAYYAGVLRDPWTGAEYQGRHAPMITPAQFARIQEVVRQRTKSRRHHRANPAFPLRGTLRCPSCQAVMTGAFSKGHTRRYAYYKCFNRACPTRSRSYSAGAAHDEFLGFLTRFSLHPSTTKAVVDALLELSDEGHKQVKSRQAQQRKTVNELEDQLAELISMRSKRLISNDEFVAQRQGLKEKMFQLQETANLAHRKQVLSEDEAKRLVESFADLKLLWSMLVTKQAHGFEDLLLPTGYVHGRIRTAETGLLFRITEASNIMPSDLVPLIKPHLNELFNDIRRFLAFVVQAETTEQVAA